MNSDCAKVSSDCAKRACRAVTARRLRKVARGRRITAQSSASAKRNRKLRAEDHCTEQCQEEQCAEQRQRKAEQCQEEQKAASSEQRAAAGRPLRREQCQEEQKAEQCQCEEEAHCAESGRSLCRERKIPALSSGGAEDHCTGGSLCRAAAQSSE